MYRLNIRKKKPKVDKPEVDKEQGEPNGKFKFTGGGKGKRKAGASDPEASDPEVLTALMKVIAANIGDLRARLDQAGDHSNYCNWFCNIVNQGQSCFRG